MVIIDYIECVKWLNKLIHYSFHAFARMSGLGRNLRWSRSSVVERMSDLRAILRRLSGVVRMSD